MLNLLLVTSDLAQQVVLLRLLLLLLQLTGVLLQDAREASVLLLLRGYLHATGAVVADYSVLVLHLVLRILLLTLV